MQFDFRVREVEPEEIETVLSIIEEIFPGACPEIDDADRIFIAAKPDRIIGFVHVSEGCRRVVLNGIGVIEDSRNFGVGTALMETVLGLAECSDKPVYLMTTSLSPALSLYENFGFCINRFGADRHLLVKKAFS